MHLKSLQVLVIIGALVTPWQTPPANAKPPEILPLAKIHRGQTGYGLTTFAGTKPERFEFEVIGVNRNFLPKMDIILVKSDDPKLAITGFWQGMSGSPLFIDGKLACAFSYGFRFNKVAIGGCTPIEYMQAQGFVPRRMAVDKDGRVKSASTAATRSTIRARSVASLAEWLEVAPEGTADSALHHMSGPRRPWLMRAPLPAAPRGAANGDGGMMAAAVPLAMSGFTAPAFAEARQLMDGYPIEPMRAGGSGDPTSGPTEFTMGGALGVQLMRGDVSATATGTVSFIDGNRVLAFGHPLFQAGEIYAPVTVSEVHTVIPSAQSAFVIASPMRELGALVQDRQSTIMADTNLKTRMIPIDISIESSRGGESGKFHVEIFDNRFFTAPLAAVVAGNAVARYLPDRDRVTVYMDSTVYLRGHAPLHFIDHLYGDSGTSRVIAGARGLRVLVPLYMNPFSPVDIERIDLAVKIDFDANFGEIDHITMPGAELIPGRRNHVDVHMTTYDGKPFVERVPFDVPANLAGSIVRVTVVAGDSAGVDAAPPQSIDDLLATFRRLMPGNVFAVIVETADEGIAIDGKLIHDLPASALDKFKQRTTTGRSTVYRPASRSSYPTARVIDGAGRILVKVANK